MSNDGHLFSAAARDWAPAAPSRPRRRTVAHSFAPPLSGFFVLGVHGCTGGPQLYRAADLPPLEVLVVSLAAAPSSGTTGGSGNANGLLSVTIAFL